MKILINMSEEDYATLKDMQDVGLGYYHELILKGKVIDTMTNKQRLDLFLPESARIATDNRNDVHIRGIKGDWLSERQVIVDDKKEVVIAKLNEMSLQELALAYCYVHKLVAYGADVTQTWATVVEQSAYLENAYRKGYYEGKGFQANQEADKTYADVIWERIRAIDELEANNGHTLASVTLSYLDTTHDCTYTLHEKDGE